MTKTINQVIEIRTEEKLASTYYYRKFKTASSPTQERPLNGVNTLGFDLYSYGTWVFARTAFQLLPLRGTHNSNFTLKFFHLSLNYATNHVT